MSNKYTTVDIIVGVGMCAIVFGAILFFVAATGSFQVAPIENFPVEQPSGVLVGMTWLQPALGQAIVEQTLLEQRTDRGMAGAAAEWNRATMARDNLQSISGEPLERIMRQAATAPSDHAARVQTIMGREIVNFTARGIRSEVLSANQYLSDYNDRMIRTTKARGERLDQEFASTWQMVLGREIVDAIQSNRILGESIQERLGSAVTYLTHVQATSEEARAENQYQLASLIVAASGTDALADLVARLAAAGSKPEKAVTASTEMASWPEIPMGFLIAAAIGLAAIFFGGLTMAGTIRERRALAEMNRNNARWVYRMAA